MSDTSEQRLQEALAQLSWLERSCLLLSVNTGFTQEEIADILDVPEEDVSTATFRGHEQLRRAYYRTENAHETQGEWNGERAHKSSILESLDESDHTQESHQSKLHKKKLLVVTAGTVAAGVGEALEKQVAAHPYSNLDVMVRYIDTARLSRGYGTLHDDERFQMNIEQSYMKAISTRIEEYPRIARMLFPGLLPVTAVSGGGGIRYNGAGAIEVQRESIQRWLSGSMVELAQAGNKEANVSMALVVSAVGATGSGSLEHLIDVIVDAAHHARITSITQSDIRCDVFILQPGGQGVTEIGLANTLALYAELAASHLTQHSSTDRHYEGRKIMVGWGGTMALSSISQLREEAATLIRLSGSSSTSLAAEVQEREVGDRVPGGLDPISKLPMHLSTAAAVTISLGDLAEQITRRDAAMLMESLFFGETRRDTDKVFLSKVSPVLSGEGTAARFKNLIEQLSVDDIRQKISRLDEVILDVSMPLNFRVNTLKDMYDEIARDIHQSTRSVQSLVLTAIDNTLKAIESAKYELIIRGGYSLSELREEYKSLEDLIESVLEEALKGVETAKTNEDEANSQVRGLQSAWPMNMFRQQERVLHLVNAMKQNLQDLQIEVARESALAFLEEIKNYCARVGQNLDVILQRLKEQRAKWEGWAAAYRDFSIETGHPLYLMALSTSKEIADYTKRVSIFSQSMAGRDVLGTEQFLEFREWLKGEREVFDSIFEGEVEHLSGVAMSYAREKVRERIRKRTVLDVLLEAGETVLRDRLKVAVARTGSLVNYDPDFAPDRREEWRVSAMYNLDQREKLHKAMEETIKGQITLLSSNDPTEIAVYYYVDAIPMSAVDDLKGRCLQAFLKRRQMWYQQQPLKINKRPATSYQRVAVPVYSGRDAERRVIESGVIQRLYEVKGVEVDDFCEDDILELGPYHPASQQGNHVIQESKKKITMYATTWSESCRFTKRWLDSHGIAYDYINIEENEQAAAYVALVNNGARSVPTIIFPDGSILVEPSIRQFLRKFATSGIE